MATQNPISTISYNSEAFLREKLEELYSSHIIQAYQYIFHYGEDGDKDHIHLRIEPNKRIDPMDIADMLQEFTDINGQPLKKPLGVRPFRPSKEEDWFLYAVHDAEYLKLKYNNGDKGEKLPYNWQDIKVPENYDLEIAFIRAKATLKHSTVNMAQRLQNGEKAMSLIMQGENVFVVNNLTRALYANDYERLASEYSKLQHNFETLLKAINEAGYEVEVNENGAPYLAKTDAPTSFCEFLDNEDQTDFLVNDNDTDYI